MSRTLKLDVSNRADYEVDEGDTLLPSWLSRFADEYKEQLSQSKTSVEVARERTTSITDSIHSIVNGRKLPYANVNDAVDYYADRVGLNEFKKQALAQEILAAGEEVENKKKDLNKEMEAGRPALLVRVPAIESYIHNVISTNYGAQLPAILHNIAELFSKSDGINESDLDDPELAKYINRLLMEKRVVRDINDCGNLGKGVGTSRDYFEVGDSNRDPFSGLMPKRVY